MSAFFTADILLLLAEKAIAANVTKFPQILKISSRFSHKLWEEAHLWNSKFPKLAQFRIIN